jgi:hypothetical protein
MFFHLETPENWVPRKLQQTKELCVAEDSVSMIYGDLTSGTRVGLMTPPRFHTDFPYHEKHRRPDRGRLSHLVPGVARTERIPPPRKSCVRPSAAGKSCCKSSDGMPLESRFQTDTIPSLQPQPPISDSSARGDMLALKGLEPFGIGGRRWCFVHPLDPKKCVKVLRTDHGRTVRLKKKRIMPASWRREYDNNLHEMRVLEELQQRIGPAMAGHLPRCYGMSATDLGPGLVLDLIRDHDGGISRSIRELITIGCDVASLKDSFDEFGRFLSNHLILTRNLLDHNLVVQMRAEGPGPMFLIDGLGDPAWLPLSRWIPALGRAKVARRIDDAWRRFGKFAASGGVTDELIRESTWGQGILRHRG